MASPLDEVLEQFQVLLDARAQAPVPREAGRGNFRCENCEDCSHCRFCTDCKACEDCTYCEGCVSCTACTHCKDCDRCTKTTHSTLSNNCSDSSYLTLCLDCRNSVQCFACVGLDGAEFCILNEKLPRKAYFSRVAKLRGALEERLASGWRPPWKTPDEPEDEAEDGDEVEAEADDSNVELVEPPEEPSEEPRVLPPPEDPAPDDSSVALRLDKLWEIDQPQSPAASSPSPDPAESSPPTPELAARPRQGTPPWTFDQVKRRRGLFLEQETKPGRPPSIPEPPPFGAESSPRRSAFGRPARRSAEPYENEPPRRRGESFDPDSPHRRGNAFDPDPPDARRRRAAFDPDPPRRRPEDLADPRPETADAPQERADGDEPTQRREQAELEPQDRYGWSAQQHELPPRRAIRPEEPPPRRGWSAAAHEREKATRPARPRRRDPWGQDTSEVHAVAEEGAPQRTWSGSGSDDRSRWRDSTRDAPSRRDRELDLDRRRRETAATPAADPVADRDYEEQEEAPPPPSHEADSLSRELESWAPYEDARRARIGPDEQTEPDAPVARRGPARAEISGAARASSADRSRPEPNRPEPTPTRLPMDPDGAAPRGPRGGPSRSLGVARRPERPRPPTEPRERGGLLRGRAPTRPSAPPARQDDAPSLRRARRPARSREETPTSEFRAAGLDDDYDPESGM